MVLCCCELCTYTRTNPLAFNTHGFDSISSAKVKRSVLMDAIVRLEPLPPNVS